MEIGSRRWNWKFREKQDTEILLHSSLSFWPLLSTSGSGWDLASPQPWKNVKNVFSIFLFFFLSLYPAFSRKFQFHCRDPNWKIQSKIPYPESFSSLTPGGPMAFQTPFCSRSRNIIHKSKRYSKTTKALGCKIL